MEKRNYKVLSESIEALFNRFGIMKLDYGKPYYADIENGKVLRVAASNKLRYMSDGAKTNQYGSLKLKQKDGSFKSVKTHRIKR